MNTILAFEEVCFSYDTGHFALDHLSVSLHAGERIAVLGNNGAGKSTFFLCCNGVLQPQAGTLSLLGQPVGTTRYARMALRRAVGLVFQDPDHQILAGTVESEISFGPMNLGLSEPQVRARVEETMEQMQLTHLRTRAPQYLSGGEKKRVSIADVLAMEPKLLLLDEPTASLDATSAAQLERHLAVLHARGIGLVIATHDIDFAWRWADRILLFHQGMLCADDTPHAIFSNTQLLEKCALTQPTLFQVGLRLGLDPLPRSIADIACKT